MAWPLAPWTRRRPTSPKLPPPSTWPPRRVLALGSTVIAVMSGSGSSSPTALVIEGVNEDSALSVLNPASPAHTPEAWSFDDMMQNAGVLLALRAA